MTVESHRLYAGSGPGPSLSLVEAELPLEPRSLNNLEAVRAGPVSSEAGCNETYTRPPHTPNIREDDDIEHSR